MSTHRDPLARARVVIKKWPAESPCRYRDAAPESDGIAIWPDHHARLPMTIVPPIPTAPAPTAIALDALDASAASGLYLRPAGLLTGSAAMDAAANGTALPLAGGETVFTLVELLARTKDG